MIDNYDDADTQYVFDLVGQHAELKTILSAIIKWLEDRISDAMVSIIVSLS